MALGFTVGATNISPDKQLTRSTSPKVKLATFGDGYEQRLRDGINGLSESYNLSFNNRTKNDIDDIVAFFDTKHGVVPFNFTIPDSNGSGSETTITVVCDTYTQKYDYDNFYSATATFRRVYE
jgi:phage-related protein|tara:strand:- start:667 stop:1035 length:369 start_codon:yes stop_codon:yes gene_type:complete